MAFLTAPVPWAADLDRVAPALVVRIRNTGHGLGDVDLWADEQAAVLHVEVPGVDDALGAAWAICGALSLLWPGWLDELGVGAHVRVGSLVVEVPAAVMAGVCRRRVGRGRWLAESTTRLEVAR